MPFINNKLGIELESPKKWFKIHDSRFDITLKNYKSKHLRFLVFELINVLVEDKNIKVVST